MIKDLWEGGPHIADHTVGWYSLDPISKSLTPFQNNRLNCYCYDSWSQCSSYKEVTEESNWLPWKPNITQSSTWQYSHPIPHSPSNGQLHSGTFLPGYVDMRNGFSGIKNICALMLLSKASSVCCFLVNASLSLTPNCTGGKSDRNTGGRASSVPLARVLSDYTGRAASQPWLNTT